jgi:hypothetical protein
MTIPANIIIAWSGAINEIPNGWVLCDGNNNTPNLRNRFVVGVSATKSFNSTGGSANATLVSHTHTVSSISTVGNHAHSFTGGRYPQGGAGPINPYITNNQIGVLGSEPGGAHSHNLILNTVGEDPTNKNLPPYYALAFIMKEA